MTKRVKLARDSNVLQMDEVAEFDNLSLDGSQGEVTTGSQDASDYEDNPKRAPDRLHFGRDWCLKLFQLSNDEERGVVRVCGGGQDCKRSGHKRITEQGDPGVYDMIKTLNYVDGILNTFRMLDNQKWSDAACKASLEEVTAELMGSKFYQRKMLAIEREFEEQEGTSNQDDGDKPDDGELEPKSKWDDHIPEEDLKLLGKVKGGSPKKIIERRKTTGKRSGAYSTNSSKEDEMSILVKDVQEALKDMAVSMSDLAAATKGNQGGAERCRKKGDPDFDESSEDEDTSPVKSRKKSPAKAATADKKCYYAVAKG
jgi:hypothetical protein